MNKSHYNESLSHNSELSTEHETLSFFNEIVAKEDTEKVYISYCHCINLHFNKENQI